MAERSESKFLHKLESQFVDKNPVLEDACGAYHGLDQIALELALLDRDETMASKTCWWPLITLIGIPASGKAEFINKYLSMEVLDSGVQATETGFTIFNFSEKDQLVTLPGTALDRDPRFPFYHISERMNVIKPGESRNINSYLELKTCNADSLNGKIIISAPGFETDPHNPVTSLLMKNAVEPSDLVLVFFDSTQTDLEPFSESLTEFFNVASKTHNPGKFIFVISHWGTGSKSVDLVAWKNRLAAYGLESAQFYVLQGQTNISAQLKPVEPGFIPTAAETATAKHSDDSDQKAIEQKIANIHIDCAYRILHSLEHNIHDIEEVAVSEVRKAIKVWKDRSHFTTSLVLSVIVFILIGMEIHMGLLSSLMDPVLGPVALLILIVLMIPLHVFIGKQHAKWIIKDLKNKQQELGLQENLSAFFAKNLTFWRTLLPIKEPAGWNKETQARLLQLIDRSRELVQSLNDSFSTIAN